MMITANQFTAASKANLETLTGLSAKTFIGFEKFVELNVAAAKALVTESIEYANGMLAARDVQRVMALQTGLVAPITENTTTYGRHVYGIAVETSAEFTKVFEGKAAEGQKAFGQAVENMAKSAPAGTESAVAVLKSALASSQRAIESAQKTARQALAMAENNVTTVTEKALCAAAAVSQTA